MPTKIYHASCDCKKITCEANLDLSKGTFKCNCGICWKSRLWAIGTTPDQFKLLKGESDLSVYGKNILHHFCKHCGIKLFGKSADGKSMAIMVSVLDDLDPQELVKAPVRYFDGLHDDFKTPPAFIAHL